MSTRPQPTLSLDRIANERVFGREAPELSRWTGRFVDPGLERRFIESRFERELTRYLRISIGISTAVYLSYGLHDAFLIPEIASQAWTIRYGFFAPIAALVCALLFTRWLPRLHQPAMLAFGLAANLTVIWIGAISPERGFFIYTSYAVLFVMVGPLIAWMNVATQVLYTSLSLALYIVLEATVTHSELPVVVSICGTMTAVGAIAAVVARQLELQARRSYLMERVIRDQVREIDAERGRSEALLLNVLPEPIAKRLKEDSQTIADGFEDVTVLFSDIVGFTKMSESLPPEVVVRRLNDLFSAFDDLVDELELEKIKTIGDAYMAVGGLYGRCDDHPEAIAMLALGMQSALRRWSEESGVELEVRVGLHCGPVIAGVIGKRKFIYDVWGDTVNTASRMESHGEPGRIHVTDTLRTRLEGRFELERRGEIDVKGKGSMTTWFLTGIR